MNPLVIVGCGRKKRELTDKVDRVHGVEAETLYVGNLFAARRRYARAVAPDSWFIASALYGLLGSRDLVKPYDLTLTDLPEVDRAAWHVGVAKQLLSRLPDDARITGRVVELHAGENYARALGGVLTAVGFKVHWPVEGLGIGEQLAFYAGHATRHADVAVSS